MMRACKSARPMCAPASPCQPRGRGGTFPRYSATAPSPFVACRVCFTRRSKRIPRTQRRGGRCGWTNKKKTLERVWAALRARVQKCISFLPWTSTTAMRAAAVWAFCAEVVVVRPHLISKVGLRLPCCSHNKLGHRGQHHMNATPYSASISEPHPKSKGDGEDIGLGGVGGGWGGCRASSKRTAPARRASSKRTPLSLLSIPRGIG